MLIFILLEIFRNSSFHKQSTTIKDSVLWMCGKSAPLHSVPAETEQWRRKRSWGQIRHDSGRSMNAFPISYKLLNVATWVRSMERQESLVLSLIFAFIVGGTHTLGCYLISLGEERIFPSS